MSDNLSALPLTEILSWDVVNWSQAIKYWDAAVSWNDVDRCLELGAKRGGLSQWLAMKGKSVICSDLENPRQHAHKYHVQAKVDSMISYEDINATSIPYENHFDIVVFKSMLGAIGYNDRKDLQVLAIQQMHKALKPGGYLLFAENSVASSLHRFARRRFIQWGQDWRYVSMPEMREFLSIFSSHTLRTTGLLGAFGRSESQRRWLAAIDSGIDRFAPAKWKYIMYGIARK